MHPAFSYFADSDTFQALRAGLVTGRRFDFATRVVAQYQHTAYRQHGQRLDADRELLGVEREWHPLRLVAQLGASEYSTGVVRPLWTLQGEIAPWAEYGIGAAYDRYDVIDDASTIRSAQPAPGDRGPSVLQGDRMRGWLRAPLPARFRLSALGSLAFLTDGNRSDTGAVAVTRRVLRHPRIDLTADVRTYGAAERSPRYWSPHRYWTSGLAISIDQPLPWGLHIRLESRGGYAQEDGVAVAEMSYGARFDADLGHGWSTSLAYRAGESARNGGYSSRTAMAELTYRFPVTLP